MKASTCFQHLAHLFRGPFLRKVAGNRYHKELSERLELCGLAELMSLPLSDVFESIYKLLLQKYRCEYVFKNALTQDRFSSQCPTNGSYITDEFRVGKNRVDLAVFSDTSTAFEIKTEYDSTIRLDAQTREYAKVFDLVYVVTTKAFRPKIESVIGLGIGIMELDISGVLTKVRESNSHSTLTSLCTSFDCLRQAEMLSIAEAIANAPVNVPRSQIYHECRRRFRTLLPFEGHQHVLRQLRSRKGTLATAKLMAEVPTSLKHAALTLRATNQEVESIRLQLNSIAGKAQKKTAAQYTHADLFPIPSRKAKRANCLARAFSQNS